MTKNKSHQIDEGFFDTLIGDAGAAGAKSLFTRGMTQSAQLAQDLFIKDFVSDAIASLNAGVKGGYINTGLRGGTTAATKNNSNPPSDSNPQPGGNPPTGTNPAGGAGNPAGATNVNPANAAQANAKRTGGKLKGQLSDDPRAVARRQATAARRAAVAGLQVSYPPKNTPPAPENTRPPRPAKPVKPTGGTIKESSYNRLNALFESIMEATAGQSVAAYMTSWFDKYMGGIDWETNKATIQPLIQSIEDKYPRGDWKGAIKKLANAAFALAKSAKATPDGAKNIQAPGTPPGTPAAAPGSANPGATKQLTVNEIKQALPNMRLRDLQSIKQSIDAIIAAKSRPAANPAAQPTTTTESRRYRR